MRKRASAGFTLIELMIVVAIVGILATVAIPTFGIYQVRSRTSERAMITKQIQNGLSELWIREGHFPTPQPFGSQLTCPPNPVGVPRGLKRHFDPGLGQWTALMATIEGSLYYTYRVDALSLGGWRLHIVTSTGDVDGDGNQSVLARTYSYWNDAAQPIMDDDLTPGVY